MEAAQAVLEAAHLARAREDAAAAARRVRENDATLVTTPVSLQILTALLGAERDLTGAACELGRLVTLLDVPKSTRSSADDAAADTMCDELHGALQKTFKHDTFRPGQLEVLESLMVERRDTVFLASSGNGKSLSWMLPPTTPAWHREGCVSVCFSGFRVLVLEQADHANVQLGDGIVRTSARSGCLRLCRLDPT